MRGALSVADSMLLTENPPVPLEELVTEDEVAFLARDAVRVEFSLLVCFQVLPFYAAIALCAERVVVLVVVPCAVRVVVVDIEVDALKQSVAILADETLSVISTSQPTVGGAD